MDKMINFDSFTLIPAYSDITSRTEVDISTIVSGLKSELPIINANMLAICSKEMVNILSCKYNSFSSYHRFFESEQMKKQIILSIQPSSDNFWMSIGAKKEEFNFIEWLYQNQIYNVIIDTNHGHHKMVGTMINHIITNYPKMKIMAGNVSSTDGIKYLRDCGAHIIKVGNSFGFSCSTIKATGFGVHPLHSIKTYREETGDWDTELCPDGGIRNVADIAKCLIWGNIVMIGAMLAGCDESYGTKINYNGAMYKEYFGNASAKTKQVASDENHVRFIEGTTKLVPCTGEIDITLDAIKDGLRSAFSFVGARNLKEFQIKAPNQILMV